MTTYRVMAHTSGGFRGRATSVCKSNGKPLTGLSEDEAKATADRYNFNKSPFGVALVWYTVERDPC